MKATEAVVDIALGVSKISTGMTAVKFSVKLSPATVGFVNYSRIKVSPDF